MTLERVPSKHAADARKFDEAEVRHVAANAHVDRFDSTSDMKGRSVCHEVLVKVVQTKEKWVEDLKSSTVLAESRRRKWKEEKLILCTAKKATLFVVRLLTSTHDPRRGGHGGTCVKVYRRMNVSKFSREREEQRREKKSKDGGGSGKLKSPTPFDRNIRTLVPE